MPQENLYFFPKYRPESIPSHPRIAYLTRGISGAGGIATDTARLLWHGIHSTCKELGIRLITLVGSRTGDLLNNSIYDLVEDGLVDGIITWVTSNIGPQRSYLDRFRNTPIVSLSVRIGDKPVVDIDNKSGMKGLISHLVDVHGLSKIAFIRGPKNHVYAMERMQAYKESLLEHGLPYNQNLISDPDEWSKSTGREAVRFFLDRRDLRPGRNMDALVCVNDRIALGAIEELRARGFRIPEDIVVTGFNNLEEARSHEPPISSVDMPFIEQASEAVKLLNQIIRTGKAPREVRLPSRAVFYESCGCPNRWIQQDLKSGDSEVSLDQLLKILESRHSLLASEITDSGNFLGIINTRDQADDIITSLIHSLEAKSTAAIQDAVLRIVEMNRHLHLDLFQWQALFSFFRRHIYDITNAPDVLLSIEDVLRGAVGFILDLRIRNESMLQMESILRAEGLQNVDHALTTALDYRSIVEALRVQLPLLNIPSFYLVVFEMPPEANTSGGFVDYSRLLLAYTPRGRQKVPPDGIRFPTKRVLPRGLPSAKRDADYLFRSLSFGDEKIGYMVFELGPTDGATYDAIALRLSAALKNSSLADRLREKTRDLVRVNEELAVQQDLLDTFIESVPDLIYFTDIDGHITKANSALLRWFGFSTQSEVLGERASFIFPFEMSAGMKRSELDILSSGSSSLNVEEQVRNNTGDQRWLLTTKMPLYSGNGVIKGLFSISRDVTDLKETNANLETTIQELTNMQRQLVEAEKMAALGELVAGVAHEINSPLGIAVTAASAVADYVDEMRLEYSDTENHRMQDSRFDDVQDMSKIVLSNLRRAADLVRSFKMVAVDQQYEEPRNILLGEYVRNIIDSLEPQIKKGHHRIEIDCPADIRIFTYPGLIGQILTNLVMNSVVHGFEGRREGDIHIRILQFDNMIHLEYKDNGRGMDDVTLAKVFNPFFTTKRGQGGSGLGMHIVYNLLTQKLGGSISVQSAVDDGTVFDIRFPDTTLQS